MDDAFCVFHDGRLTDREESLTDRSSSRSLGPEDRDRTHLGPARGRLGVTLGHCQDGPGSGRVG